MLAKRGRVTEGLGKAGGSLPGVEGPDWVSDSKGAELRERLEKIKEYL